MPNIPDFPSDDTEDEDSGRNRRSIIDRIIDRNYPTPSGG